MIDMFTLLFGIVIIAAFSAVAFAIGKTWGQQKLLDELEGTYILAGPELHRVTDGEIVPED